MRSFLFHAVQAASRPTVPQPPHLAPFRRPSLPLAAFAALVALAPSACRPPATSTAVLELSGGWEFRRADAPPGPGFPGRLADTLSTWLPATVPGTVHTDLLAAGVIPDPFWRDNEMALQWIGGENWVYRTTFQAGLEILDKEAVDLVFHGLDTFARILLNGHEILYARNMFRTWEVEVRDVIIPGDNALEVRFRSPLPPALEARARLPYELPAGNDRGDPPSRVFVRKAAYHYGWDWGPRFVTSGIWRPVDLVAWSGARVTDLWVQTDSILEGEAFLTAEVELRVSKDEAERRSAGGGVPVTLTLSSPDGSFGPVRVQHVPVAGANRVAVPLRIPSPELWWPNGLGNAYLYSVEATLDAGRRTHSLRTRTGIRTVELVTEPDSVGESFFFRINGVPVFMKGANVVPLDHFSPRVTEQDHRALFRDVVDANMNMLRVWGGGIYMEDLFYDLADEHGILVWQDFMFANGMYPGDSAFLANVRAEARDQVRRLRSHASLALWCGNNEMDEGWHNWGWARQYSSPEDSAAVWEAYEDLFHRVLPEEVAAGDPGRPYWPSSPSLGWGNPESLNRGDSHYWGVWHGQEPFQVYAEKLPRFSSEYGFQAFPAMRTVEAFTEPGDRSLSDPVMLIHQKHPVGNELIRLYMEWDYPVPSAFADFVYVSQLLQARGMGTAFEAHRRAMPRTMGSLYWQLNDTWPVVSWSSRDYFGHWKALHYTAKKAFAPLLVSPILRGDTVEVWGVSDLLEPVESTLQLELLGFDGTILWQAPVSVTVGPNGSRALWQGSVSELLGDADPRRVVLHAWLRMEGVGIGRESSPQEGRSPGRDDPAQDHRVAGQSTPEPSTLLYFRPPKDLELGAPAIRLGFAPAGDGVLLTLESDVLAKNVYLSANGARPEGEAHELQGAHPPEGFHAVDNFFDLLPRRPRTVLLRTRMAPEDVEKSLIIRTLAEIPREGIVQERR
jgi:beta-mannosidase